MSWMRTLIENKSTYSFEIPYEKENTFEIPYEKENTFEIPYEKENTFEIPYEKEEASHSWTPLLSLSFIKWCLNDINQFIIKSLFCSHDNINTTR